LRKYILITILLLPLIAQDTAHIKGLRLESKTNGVYIHIQTDKALNQDWVTGWQNGGRFYITILNASGNIKKIESSETGSYIRSITAEDMAQSLQITLNMSRTVEQYEFFFIEKPPGLFLSLRFPVSDLLASMEPDMKNQFHPNRGNSKKNPESTVLIKAFYILGSSLVAAGFLSKEDNRGWEIPAGMGLIAGAYIYNNFINPKNNGR